MIEGLPSNLPGPANVKGQALGGHDWVPLFLFLSSRFNRARPEILDTRDRLADRFPLAWVVLYPVLLALHAGPGWTTDGWLPASPHTAGWSTRRVWDFWLSMAVGTPVVGGMFLIVIQGIFRAWEKLVEELERKLEEQA